MTIARADEALRIAYWRTSMDQGRRFMDRLLEYPVAECGEPLASIEKAATCARIEMEFSTTPIVGDIPRIFEVREGLIEPLMAVGREMNGRGWVLKIEDGFRTRDSQRTVARQPRIFDMILRRVSWETGSDEPDVTGPRDAGNCRQARPPQGRRRHYPGAQVGGYPPTPHP